ncbi:MAG: efflux RND transporter periplasmic adaptor subunit [Bacteroidota bacterium]
MRGKQFLLYGIVGLMITASCSRKKVTEEAVPGMASGQGISLSKVQMQLANIKTAVVKLEKIGEETTFSGKLVVDQNTTQVITSKVKGRIDKLYLKTTGDMIKKGDLLYDIYSEDLVSAQKEYILALEKQKKLGGSGNDYSQFIESAKNKLLLYGLSGKQLEQLKASAKVINTISIQSDVSGYILEVNAREGDYVMPGSLIFQLADYSTLWIEAQTYTSDIGSIRENATVNWVVDAFPDEVMPGKISFLNPELERSSSISLIRVNIGNAGNKYKPGMMAEVRLKSNEKDAIALPVDAVIEEANSSTVWVQDADGMFNVRMVTTGIRNSDRIEIISGLAVGEKVVISGSYLLNSEYILKNGSNPMDGMKM